MDEGGARTEITDELLSILERHSGEGWYRELKRVPGPGDVIAIAVSATSHRRAYFRVVAVEPTGDARSFQFQVAVEMTLSDRFERDRIAEMLAWTRSTLTA